MAEDLWTRSGIAIFHRLQNLAIKSTVAVPRKAAPQQDYSVHGGREEEHRDGNSDICQPEDPTPS